MSHSQPDEAPCLHGLEAWAEYFETRELPVRVSILTRFRHLLGNDRTTLEQLARLISSDPVLSLHVTRLAQQLHQHKGTSVTSIQHAVGSIGMERLDRLARQLTSLKVNPASMQHKMYFRAIADSLHASVQSAELCRQRGLPFVEEVRLASLLYGFTHWMAWLHAPLHKQYYQQRVLLQGVDVALAEQDLFGCTLQSLGAELARRWALPTLTQEALNHSTSPSRNDLKLLHRRAVQDPSLDPLELREINQLTQQRFFPVKLGNWLALTTTRGWHSTKAHRLYDILADYLSQPPDRLLSQLHMHCAEAARRYHIAGTLSPAAEMIMLPTQATQPLTGLIPTAELKRLAGGPFPPIAPSPSTATAPTGSSTPTQAHLDSDSRAGNHALYAQLLRQLDGRQPPFDKPAQVLQSLLRGLHQGLGLRRLALLLVSPQRQRLQYAHSIGLTDSHPMTGLDLCLEVPSLFKRLNEKPAGIWLHRHNREKLAPLLPEAFATRVDGSDYMLMSVFQRERPLAVVYADDLDARLSQFQFDRFRQLCAAATRALRHLS